VCSQPLGKVETRKSPVWEYFTAGEGVATCQLCTRVVKRSRGNTTNLFAHLRSVHREHYDIIREEDARLKNEVQLTWLTIFDRTGN